MAEKPALEPIVLQTATYAKVDELCPSTGGHNLVARVVSNNLVIEKSRVDGSSIRIAEVTIGDETGTVVLRAKNEQIDVLRVGEAVVIRNSSIEVFKGFMRLVVTKWGKITAHPDGIKSTPAAPTSINTENNKSAVEYELVRVPGQGGGGGGGDHDEAM